MDELEQFIINNREALNNAVPDGRVWHKIKSQLEEESLKTAFLTSEENNPKPSAKVWDSIAAELENTDSSKLPQAKKAKEVRMVPIQRVWQIAASFTILLVSIVWLQYYLQNGNGAMGSGVPTTIQ